MVSNNQGIRTFSRPKRIPNTRSDDFFRGIKSNKAVYEGPTFMVLKHQGYNKHD